VAIVSLLTQADPSFDWEHANAHRAYLGVMAPLTRFSVLPYLLEPTFLPNIPAGDWQLRHQQAHDDALTSVPSQYGSTAIGLRIGQNLLDERRRQWWTFNNHQNHYIADTTVLPPGTPPSTYPFW
jgi:hypothetical protein